MLQQQLLLPPRKPPARIRRSLLRSRAIERVIVKGVARVKVAHLAPCVIKTSSSSKTHSFRLFFLEMMKFKKYKNVFTLKFVVACDIYTPGTLLATDDDACHDHRYYDSSCSHVVVVVGG